jgi:hypothetical protein
MDYHFLSFFLKSGGMELNDIKQALFIVITLRLRETDNIN